MLYFFKDDTFWPHKSSIACMIVAKKSHIFTQSWKMLLLATWHPSDASPLISFPLNSISSFYRPVFTLSCRLLALFILPYRCVWSARGDVVLETPQAQRTGKLCTRCGVYPGSMWITVTVGCSTTWCGCVPHRCFSLTWFLSALPCYYTDGYCSVCVCMQGSMCVWGGGAGFQFLFLFCEAFCVAFLCIKSAS